MRFRQVKIEALSEGLKTLGSIKKYCLLNSRFINPSLYNDKTFLNQTLDKLELLVSDSDITGIVFSDAYFLNAVASTKRKIISQLEAVPGINCMIDSEQKAFSFFEIIEQTGFKLPSKIVLDRSLNRNIELLKRTAREIKKKRHHLKIELLANEGCIYHCPFKLTHDSQISFSNTQFATDKNFQTNHAIGCHAYFHKTPEKFFKSPFIRPEDIEQYDRIADTIKLCGRTIGFNFLFQCIDAYINKTFKGNLLSLMDATHWLSDVCHIDNKSLDPDFFKILTSCTKDCKKCKICSDLMNKTAYKKPFKIKAYKDYR
ncbi:MAG: hypothetical protein GY699_04225 [Desulfobacteraceae bacterium]|nr:hypothetical protein [Desulfobacteraceae bacterium]